MANQKKERSTARKWTRRAFIGVGGLAGVGLVVGVGGYMHISSAVKKYSGKGMGDGNSMNAWVRIAPDNTVTIAVARAEMGQGVTTALPQLVAEELEVDMNSIKVVSPQPESPYSNTFLVTKNRPNAFKGYDLLEKVYAFLPVIATGGSTSVIDAWTNMRFAGATAREMLKTAAAKQWGTSLVNCKAENGYVINTATNDRLSYGELAEAASSIELDELPTLKKKEDFKIVGKPVKRLDSFEKVTGTAEYGIDIRLDGMLYAAIKHPSTIGAKIKSVSNEDTILNMPGVKKVLVLEDGPAAVVADNTWLASKAAQALQVEEEGGDVSISTEGILAQMNDLLKQKPLKITRNDGNVADAFAQEQANTKTIEARYDLPYLAHATMEPMNATVLVKDGKATLWCGHQAASVAHTMVEAVSGIPKKDITVNTTYLGGGFGRRGEPDFVRYATAVAKEMEGTPVQTIFTREEDMKNDMYRPMAASQFKAKISGDGELIAWDNKMVLQSCSNNAMGRIMPSMATAPADDETTAEGADNMPYVIKNQRVAFNDIQLPIQIGYWRSVGYSQNGFFAESFFDECAHAVGKDPYEFRRSKLGNHPRFAAVLDKVAEISNWKTPLPEGKYRGISLVKSYNSIVGEVVEISKQGEKEFKIDKVYAAIDCGNVVNPDIVDTQVQGGIIFGLTAALYGEITWKDGQVVQSNFPNYEMVRMGVCPEIQVHIMDIDEPPGGVGEPGTPPAAPALANALFAATGERIRTLPLNKQGYKFV